MPTRLKVGVIGLGAVAQIMHLPYLQELDELYQISAIADLAPATLQVVGDFYHVERRFTDYRDLLASDLDAVLILTSGSHAGLVLDALAAGKHVFVEKPLALSVREADAVVAAAEASQQVLMVGYMKRYDPGYLYAQREVASITDLRYVQVHTYHPAQEHYWLHQRIMRGPGQPLVEPGQLVLDLADLLRQLGSGAGSQVDEALGPQAPVEQRIAYNVLVGSMVHDMNLLRGLLGEPESVAHTEIWSGGLAVQTTLRFPGELRAVCSWIYLEHLRDYQEHIALLGSAARVRIEFPSPYLRSMPTPVVVQRMEQGAATEKRVVVNYEEAFKEELRHFYSCITEGHPPRTGAHDARQDLYWLHQVALAWRPEASSGANR